MQHTASSVSLKTKLSTERQAFQAYGSMQRIPSHVRSWGHLVLATSSSISFANDCVSSFEGMRQPLVTSWSSTKRFAAGLHSSGTVRSMCLLVLRAGWRPASLPWEMRRPDALITDGPVDRGVQRRCRILVGRNFNRISAWCTSSWMVRLHGGKPEVWAIKSS